jgi:hypothetical protein
VIILMMYVASFAISLGLIFWLLISEIYPLKIRGLAAGIAAGANWTSNFVVSLTLPDASRSARPELDVLGVRSA